MNDPEILDETALGILMSIKDADCAPVGDAALQIVPNAGENSIQQRFALKAHGPRNEHVTVEADHLGTPTASVATVLSWLKMLEQSSLDK